ncbi:ABC transporter permease [Salinispira pacifica]
MKWTNSIPGRKVFERIGRTGVGGQLFSLLLILVLFVIGTGGEYLSIKNIQTILGLAGIPIIIALGLHLVIVLGAMDLSVEGIIAICGVLSGLLLRNKITPFDIGFWIIPVVIVAGALIGWVNGALNTKLRMPSFISTLGMSWAFFGIAILISGGKSIHILDDRFQKVINGELAGVPNILIMALVLLLIFHLVQTRTKFGKHVYAIGGDEQLAKQAGVNVDRVKIISFMVAGLFYGISALLLVTRLSSAAARIGNNTLFPAMTAVAVGGVALTGGIGGARNAALGALIITALNNGLVMMKVNPYAQDAVNGLVLIIAVALTIDRKKLGFIK